MKTLFKSEKGAVSVFLILILVVVFIFNAVLIDYARIFIAEKQTERAVKTGVRSVMSSFDSGLVRYGLFGLNGDPNNIFKEVVEKNLPQQDADHFQFVDTKLESMNILPSGDAYSLARVDVYEEQILQNMKYMAPIEFTKIMLEKFKMNDLQQDMADASAFIDVMSKIEPLYNAREEALDKLDDQVGALLLTIKDSVEDPGMVDSIKGPVSTNITEATLGIVNVLKDIPAKADLLLAVLIIIEEKKQALAELQPSEDESEEEEEKRKEEIKDLEAEIKELEKLVENYKKNSEGLAGNIYTHYSGLSNLQIKNALTHLKTAIDKNKEIKTLLDKASSSSSSTVDTENLGDVHIDPAMLENWDNLLKETDKKVDEIAQNANALKVAIQKANWESVKGFVGYTEMETDLNEAIKHATELHGDFKKNRVKLSEEQLDTKKEKEDKAKTETEKAEEKLNKSLDLATAMVNEDLIYGQVNSHFLKYRDINKAIDDAEALKVDLEDYNKAADSAMEIMSKMMSSIGSGLYSLRDELYVNEYILKNFNSNPPYNIGRAESYFFDNKEVEYIIYGIPSAYGNYAAAYSQLFALRFAIHVVDQLMDETNRLLGHPLLIFLAVVSEAMYWTVEDMKYMTEDNDETDFFPPNLQAKLKIKNVFELKVDYRDHIRFFLLTNGKHENKLMRTQAVTEYKSTVNLNERPVQVVGEATSTVKLWFLPGVAEMLGDVGLLDGKVVDKNRYEFTKKAAYSY